MSSRLNEIKEYVLCQQVEKVMSPYMEHMKWMIRRVDQLEWILGDIRKNAEEHSMLTSEYLKDLCYQAERVE